MRMRMVLRRKRKIMGRLYAVHVVRTMAQTNSGSAATFVRSGSMGSVLRLPPLELSILSNTSAHLVATKEHALDPSWFNALSSLKANSSNCPMLGQVLVSAVEICHCV